MLLSRCCWLALLTVGLSAPAGAQPWVTPERGEHLIEGIVRDSADGHPISGAYVWLIGEPAGAVTDSTGRYAMNWSQSNGTHALVVRVCGTTDAARGQAEFTPGGGRVQRDFVVATVQPCDPLPRPPWAVGPSDTTAVSGYLVYSWEGEPGGFLLTCDGEFFHPGWPSGTELWDHNPEEGERQFVRLVGRQEDDPTLSGSFFPSKFYIWQVLEKRPAQPADCPAQERYNLRLLLAGSQGGGGDSSR